MHRSERRALALAAAAKTLRVRHQLSGEPLALTRGLSAPERP